MADAAVALAETVAVTGRWEEWEEEGDRERKEWEEAGDRERGRSGCGAERAGRWDLRGRWEEWVWGSDGGIKKVGGNFRVRVT